MNKMLLGLAGAALCVGLGATPGRATNRPVATSPRASSQNSPQEGTFTGILEWNPDTRNHISPYELYDQNQQTSYFLDDSSLSAGQRAMIAQGVVDKVQIQGTLDEAQKTIHVESVKIE